MDESTALASLLDAYRERDISFNKDEISAVVKSEDGIAWVEEHVNHETLLTKDELALYDALEKSGEAARLADSNDLSIVYPHDDNELRSAIEELQRSTAAIQKQSETLRIQQDAMKSLVKSNRNIAEARSRADDLQQRKWAAEREQISMEIDELSGGLSQRIAEQLQQRKTTDASLNQTTAEFLRADDRLLSSLQKLANELEPERPEDAELSNRIHNLCARLIKFTVQGIRVRLDRIYLEALQSPQDSKSEDDSHDAETQALQEELESLYSEILPVAQMSVEQQYLQPALRMISSNQNQGQDRSARGLEYISQCLTFINTRLSTLSTLTQDHISHQTALTHLINRTLKELHSSEETPQTGTNHTLPKTKTSPSRQRKGSLPNPSRATRIAQRRSSTNFEYEDLEPPYLLLRTLGITLPSPSSQNNKLPSTTTQTQAQIPLLQTTLASRLTLLQTQRQALTSATETSISSHIQELKITLQLLLDSLYSETVFGGRGPRLRDREVEEAMGALEGDLEVVRGARGTVVGDLEGVGGRNVGREGFVGRWGR